MKVTHSFAFQLLQNRKYCTADYGIMESLEELGF